jgi:hypothetical protein
MREAIRINGNKCNVKPIELTHCLQNTSETWYDMKGNTCDYSKIVYLGVCDGWDRFACYRNSNRLSLWKGHLNSGKY